MIALAFAQILRKICQN